ncbi:thiamine phosphate synthase [Nannocystaceae bacterium ST9]
MRVAGLYAILDLPHPRGLTPIELATAFVEGGAGLIQLRAKRATHLERLATLRAIAAICHAGSVPLLVDDDLAAAEAGIPGVSGVHLGQTDLDELGPDPARRIERLREVGLHVGISTHALGQVDAALGLGPTYLGFGPVFSTTSKRDPDPVVGLEGLTQACARADVPVVAIGGIGPEQLESVMKAGAAAIAVIGALIADTPEQTRERCHALATRLAMTSAS